jgi:hypothetical protein
VSDLLHETWNSAAEKRMSELPGTYLPTHWKIVVTACQHCYCQPVAASTWRPVPHARCCKCGDERAPLTTITHTAGGVAVHIGRLNTALALALDRMGIRRRDGTLRPAAYVAMGGR